MTDPKPTPSRRGGARPGSGRKPKGWAPDANPPRDAHDYLQRVYTGQVEPDALKVSAAKACLRFERTPTRVPARAPNAKTLEQDAAREVDAKRRAEFDDRAAAVRRKYGREK